MTSDRSASVKVAAAASMALAATSAELSGLKPKLLVLSLICKQPASLHGLICWGLTSFTPPFASKELESPKSSVDVVLCGI